MGRGARAFTGDHERLGQETFHASRQTGGWVKAAGVVAAGGAQAQRDEKRCMNSCDALLCILSVRAESIRVARNVAKCRVNSCVALLCILSVRAESIRVARNVAKCRVNSCVALLSLKKKFADGRSVSRRVRRRYGLATVYVLSDRIRLLRCRDGPLPPWACGYGYSLYGGSGSCKGEGAGWALNCVFRIAYCVRAGETATIQLFDWPAASRFQTGLTLEAFLGRLKGLTGRRDAREIARDDERMCEIV